MTENTPDERADTNSHLHPQMRILSTVPLNAETSLADTWSKTTPPGLFYLRNHFAIPQINAKEWSLSVDGAVKRPRQFTYEELRSLARRSLRITLECAGNGRISFVPAIEGEPWEWGAASTAEWTGTPLRGVLELCGLATSVREISIQGADSGNVEGIADRISYERSLPIEVASHPDTLLVYEMNGAPLPERHGYPMRLMVPGWFGMAAVKWVTHIRALEHRFEGYYQTQRYVLQDSNGSESVPLTTMPVRSLIVSPQASESIPGKEFVVRGLAWSGTAPVTQVDVSADNGLTWKAATLHDSLEHYAWRLWECTQSVPHPGPAILTSRATDSRGNTQPDTPRWNVFGYENNALQRVPVNIKRD